MNLQLSPNTWSCLATSFAMALDVPVKELIKEIGHDGSEIVFPNLVDPFNRRSFHPQEFIEPCLKRGVVFLVVEAVPTISAPNSFARHKIEFQEGYIPRLERYLRNYPGVLVGEIKGNPHSVSWDRKLCFDPNGFRYQVKEFVIREFLAFEILKSNQ